MHCFCSKNQFILKCFVHLYQQWRQMWRALFVATSKIMTTFVYQFCLISDPISKGSNLLQQKCKSFWVCFAVMCSEADADHKIRNYWNQRWLNMHSPQNFMLSTPLLHFNYPTYGVYCIIIFTMYVNIDYIKIL